MRRFLATVASGPSAYCAACASAASIFPVGAAHCLLLVAPAVAAAVQPIDFAIAPAKACDNLTKKLGMKMTDIDYHEVNEAFAAVALANIKLLDLDITKVNVHGGAVALGHPIGASGARIIMSLMNVLRRNDGQVGMASICNGGGGASAIVIERMN